MPYGFYNDRARYEIDIDSIKEQVEDALRDDILNLIYPNGSIYMTMTDDTPADLGFPGDWVQLHDRVLMATPEDGQAGATGGNDGGSITLAAGQVPLRKHQHGKGTLAHAHTHVESDEVLVRPTWIADTGKNKHHRQTLIDGGSITSYTRQSTPAKEGFNSGGASHHDGRAIIFNNLRRKSNATNAAANPVSTKGASVNALSGGSTDYAEITAVEPVDIMPPYVTVHVWQRDDQPVTSNGEANFGTIWEGEE